MGFEATFRAHNLMKLGVKELIELCIYCWGHPLLYTFSGSVAVWMLLSGNLQHPPLLVHQGPEPPPFLPIMAVSAFSFIENPMLS